MRGRNECPEIELGAVRAEVELIFRLRKIIQMKTNKMNDKKRRINQMMRKI